MIKIVKGDEVELRCDSCEHADRNGMCLWPDNCGPKPCERRNSCDHADRNGICLCDYADNGTCLWPDSNSGKKPCEQVDDVVNKPSHYTSGTVECIDYIDGLGLGQDFCAANAIKYLTRYKMKGKPVEDLEKAAWYVNHLLEKIKEGVYSV